MPTFPVPRAPLVSSYGAAGPSKAFTETQMEVGPPKRRRRSGVGLRRFSAEYQVTTAELAAFELWHRDETGMGTLTFDWPDPRTGTVRAVRFADSDGGYAIAELAPGQWRLSVSLEEWA